MYNKDIAGNDLQTIITQAIEDMKHEMKLAICMSRSCRKSRHLGGRQSPCSYEGGG